MISQGSDEDDLLNQLRTVVRRVGTPTPTMIAAGESAFSWRTVDAELAALTHDSLVDASMLVRSAAAPRSLVFEGRQLSVELDETEDGVIGQLLPPTSGVVTILRPDGQELADAVVDDLGCFCFGSSTIGTVRLRCRTAFLVLLTDWFRL